MSAALAILSYHRVLDSRSGPHRPYFERGTAVTTSTFQAQLEALHRHCDLIGEADAIDVLRGRRTHERPAALLTFDDGYRDVLLSVLPRMAGAPGVAYVTTCVLDEPACPLPADQWFAALTSARAMKGTLVVADEPPWHFDLNKAEDFARLVDGPARRTYLRAPADRRRQMLQILQRALDSRPDELAGLYLVPSDLRELVSAGWTIGSHGATHARFTDVSREECRRELRESVDALARAGLPRVRSVAYPDAAVGLGPELAAELGLELGLTLEARVADSQCDPLRAPRWLVPDDPRWVERVLVPALHG